MDRPTLNFSGFDHEDGLVGATWKLNINQDVMFVALWVGPNYNNYGNPPAFHGRHAEMQVGLPANWETRSPARSGFHQLMEFYNHRWPLGALVGQPPAVAYTLQIEARQPDQHQQIRIYKASGPATDEKHLTCARALVCPSAKIFSYRLATTTAVTL